MSYALELLMKKEPEKHARGHRTFFAKKEWKDRGGSRAGQVLPNWLNRFKDDEFRESSRNLLHFTHKKKILNQQLDELTGSMHELEHQLNFLLQFSFDFISISCVNFQVLTSSTWAVKWTNAENGFNVSTKFHASFTWLDARITTRRCVKTQTTINSTKPSKYFEKYGGTVG